MNWTPWSTPPNAANTIVYGGIPDAILALYLSTFGAPVITIASLSQIMPSGGFSGNPPAYWAQLPPLPAQPAVTLPQVIANLQAQGANVATLQANLATVSATVVPGP